MYFTRNTCQINREYYWECIKLISLANSDRLIFEILLANYIVINFILLIVAVIRLQPCQGPTLKHFSQISQTHSFFSFFSFSSFVLISLVSFAKPLLGECKPTPVVRQWGRGGTVSIYQISSQVISYQGL